MAAKKHRRHKIPDGNQGLILVLVLIHQNQCFCAFCDFLRQINGGFPFYVKVMSQFQNPVAVEVARLISLENQRLLTSLVSGLWSHILLRYIFGDAHKDGFKKRAQQHGPGLRKMIAIIIKNLAVINYAA